MALFERFHVEDQLRKALDRKVWLPSGGHIVVDRTEALTVIDVNTGRFVGTSNLEDTVLENNLEAAQEIARQLRLRDIGGIIVIDFIDMETQKNQDAVLLRLREYLAKDKTRTQVFEVSNLGLVEMTRKNVSAGLLESFSEVCPRCSGRGVLLHEDAATIGVRVGLQPEKTEKRRVFSQRLRREVFSQRSLQPERVLSQFSQRVLSLQQEVMRLVGVEFRADD